MAERRFELTGSVGVKIWVIETVEAARVHPIISRLKPRERRGSKPRCHLLTHGDPVEVARRLTALVEPFASVSHNDRWMPQGFEDLEEAQLHKAPRLLNEIAQTKLVRWWLPEGREHAMTPNLDIASTCAIDGNPGLLLVEAKAHLRELEGESKGRIIDQDSSEDRIASHETIGRSIEQARVQLEAGTGLSWNISRESHYQMSNRFAWAWKLTEMGIPVVLVYLGFLQADEMADIGQPLADSKDWEKLVLAHSAPLFPPEVWERKWLCNGQPFVPLIRSLVQPLAG